MGFGMDLLDKEQKVGLKVCKGRHEIGSEALAEGLQKPSATSLPAKVPITIAVVDSVAI